MLKHTYEIVFDSGYRIKKELLEDLEDIKRYLYERRYSRSYDSLGKYLEPGSVEFLKDIEDKWLHNKLDTSEIYKDKDIYLYHAQKIADDLYFQEDNRYDYTDDYGDSVGCFEDYDVRDVIVLR